MTSDTTGLAGRLLDAQVAHLTAELSGAGAAELVVEDLQALLDAVADVPLDQLLDREAVRATVGELLTALGDTPAVAAMVQELPVLLHDLPANDDHPLGDLVDRDAVEELVAVLAGSAQLREELLRRLGRSPAVAQLALRFVSALVGDAVQENRQRVERVPGAKSLLGMGDFAARQARGMAPKQLERMVGGAADRGTQAAMERVTRALLDTFDEDAVRAAALEVWDLHAPEDVAGLRAYLATDEVARLAEGGHEVWRGLHTSAWLAAVLDTAVDAFLAHHGDRPVGEVLDELGLTRDLVATAVRRHAPRVLQVLHEGGHVEALLRRRLAPFYRSDAALEILGGAAG